MFIPYSLMSIPPKTAPQNLPNPWWMPLRKDWADGRSSGVVLWAMNEEAAAHTAAWVIPVDWVNHHICLNAGLWSMLFVNYVCFSTLFVSLSYDGTQTQYLTMREQMALQVVHSWSRFHNFHIGTQDRKKLFSNKIPPIAFERRISVARNNCYTIYQLCHNHWDNNSLTSISQYMTTVVYYLSMLPSRTLLLTIYLGCTLNELEGQDQPGPRDEGDVEEPEDVTQKSGSEDL